MSAMHLKSALTAEQRLQKRQLIARDAVALLSLLAITCAVFFVTWALFRSFSTHRAALAQRWLVRGETALGQGHPAQAIDALRSALQYAPDQRSIEIELAEALAAAGRLQEATAYFNTLWEAEPGNGKINLALARLAAQQNLEPSALRYYQASIDGTWDGDGMVRRREVRLEMVKYLLSKQRYEPARSELLIAEGNAPDDPVVRLQIAQLLESAHDPANALEIYRTILQRRPWRLAALEGAGRSAFALGHYQLAKTFLEWAMNHPAAEKEPMETREQNRNLLRDSIHILLLYPSRQISNRARVERIMHDRNLARMRFVSCSDSVASRPGNLQPLQALALRWESVRPTLKELERDPQLQQPELQLIYDTERITSEQCGSPTGDDALLLKIAQSPDSVELP
jgi:tetratricopeptide (TPR) repeat protein